MILIVCVLSLLFSSVDVTEFGYDGRLVKAVLLSFPIFIFSILVITGKVKSEMISAILRPLSPMAFIFIIGVFSASYSYDPLETIMRSAAFGVALLSAICISIMYYSKYSHNYILSFFNHIVISGLIFNGFFLYAKYYATDISFNFGYEYILGFRLGGFLIHPNMLALISGIIL